MTAPRAADLRRNSIRVALVATGLVAVAYLIVALAVVAIVTRNLTAQIDGRLSDSLLHPPGPGPGAGHYEPPKPDRLGGPTFVLWTVTSDGEVSTLDSNPALPEEYRHVLGPVTATINGSDLRLMGAARGDDYIVIGQSLQPVTEAQSTVIVAELLIGPVLLLVVFLGAVAIGRRVATPVELARRRQLDFTADASHELRTPLSVIEANTTLALAQDRTEAWYRTAFERVDLESKRMRRLLDDLLWLARFDATQGPPNAEPVDLGVLAAQTADRFGAIAETRRLHLEVAAAAESMVVAAPPEWLDRLLGVLLDNACKYSPEGGAVHVEVAADGGRIQVTVDDAGPGIPETERSRIFDRFHRASESEAGAGLGLAIADAIVRATGGRWKIGASPAGGASMAVSWPRAFPGARETTSRRRTPTTEATR
jgi:two-component system, OmpR family, sensor histidine kinase CiaH